MRKHFVSRYFYCEETGSLWQCEWLVAHVYSLFSHP